MKTDPLSNRAGGRFSIIGQTLNPIGIKRQIAFTPLIFLTSQLYWNLNTIINLVYIPIIVNLASAYKNNWLAISLLYNYYIFPNVHSSDSKNTVYGKRKNGEEGGTSQRTLILIYVLARCMIIKNIRSVQNESAFLSTSCRF